MRWAAPVAGFAVASLVLAIGCAREPGWFREGATLEQRDGDVADCRFEASAAAMVAEGRTDSMGKDRRVGPSRTTRSDSGAAVRSQKREAEAFDACMRGRGYRRISKGE